MTISGQCENELDKMAIKCFEMIKNMYSNEYSEIWTIFYGVHVSQITSLDKEETVLSSNPEPFFMIDLSIPIHNSHPTLYDCLDLYVEGEILQGENAWMNEAKEKINVKKQIKYWSFPTILAIDLKRINPMNTRNKNQIWVDFPLENLDLSKYVIGYKKSSYVFDLYAVANHTGGTMGGHYFAYVKNANGKWYEFNDCMVREILDKNTINTPKAYCLFYRKR